MHGVQALINTSRAVRRATTLDPSPDRRLVNYREVGILVLSDTSRKDGQAYRLLTHPRLPHENLSMSTSV